MKKETFVDILPAIVLLSFIIESLIAITLQLLSIDTRFFANLFIIFIISFFISIMIWVYVTWDGDEGRPMVLFWTIITIGIIGFMAWLIFMSKKIYNHLKTRRDGTYYPN